MTRRSKLGSAVSSDTSSRQFIGRRTGKVFTIKSYDELFSDSETDASLDITRTPTVRDAGGAKNVSFPKPLSAKQKMKAPVPKSIVHSRIGRRTGKDMFAGNKKLQETGRIEKFSDLFSDTDETMSLHPTPERTISSASLASCEDSDASSKRSVRSMRRRKSHHNKSIPPVMSLTKDEREEDFKTMEKVDRSINNENLNRSASTSLRSGSKSRRSVLNSSTANKELNSGVAEIEAGVEVSPQKSLSKSRQTMEKLNMSKPSSPSMSNTRMETDQDTSILKSNKSQMRNNSLNITTTIDDGKSRDASSPLRSSPRNRSKVNLSALSTLSSAGKDSNSLLLANTDKVAIVNNSGGDLLRNESTQKSVHEQKEDYALVRETSAISVPSVDKSIRGSPGRWLSRRSLIQDLKESNTDDVTDQDQKESNTDDVTDQDQGVSTHHRTENSQQEVNENAVSAAGKENHQPASDEVSRPTNSENDIRPATSQSSTAAAEIEIEAVIEQREVTEDKNVDELVSNQSSTGGKKNQSATVSENKVADRKSNERRSNISNKQTPTDPSSHPSISHQQCLDFGGTAAGSVSNADKVLPSQFFGIKKRLTFCSRNSGTEDKEASPRQRKSYPGSFLDHHSKDKNELSMAAVPVESYVNDNLGLVDPNDSSDIDGFKIVGRDDDVFASKKQNSFVTVTGRKRSSSGDGRVGGRKRTVSDEKKDERNARVEDEKKLMDGGSVVEGGGKVDTHVEILSSHEGFGTSGAGYVVGESSSSSSMDGGKKSVKSKIALKQSKSKVSDGKNIDKSVADKDRTVVSEESHYDSVSKADSKKVETYTSIKREKGVLRRKAESRRDRIETHSSHESSQEDDVKGNEENGDIGSQKKGTKGNKNHQTSLSQSAQRSNDKNLELECGEGSSDLSGGRKTSTGDGKVDSETHRRTSGRKVRSRLRRRNRYVVVDDELDEVDGDGGEKLVAVSAEQDEEVVDPVKPQPTAEEEIESPLKPSKNRKNKVVSSLSGKKKLRSKRNNKNKKAVPDSDEEGHGVVQSGRVAKKRGSGVESPQESTSSHNSPEEKEVDSCSPVKKTKKSVKKKKNCEEEQQNGESSPKSQTLPQRGARSKKLSKKSLARGNEKEASTPLHLHPMSMLPKVTPKSGVSFRRKSSFIPSHHASVDQSQDEDGGSGDQTHIIPEPKRARSTTLRTSIVTKIVDEIVPINSDISDDQQQGTTPKVSHKRKSSNLRKRAILESARSKGLRVIVGKPLPSASPSVATHSPTGNSLSSDTENSTALPSPSSSPVHYAETTTSDRRQSLGDNIVLPDLSYKIIRPEKSNSGLRRSKRTRVQRLHDYKGGGIVYKRDSAGFRVVHSVMPSLWEAKVLAKERKRDNMRAKRKLQANAVPAKARRMSTHVPVQQDNLTESSEISVINPDTEERVVVDLVGRYQNTSWMGPDLTTLTSRDSLGMSVLLNQPSFTTGNLHIRPMCEKPRQVTMETIVYFVIHGKVCVTINNSSVVVDNRDHFFIPRGSIYAIKNLRRDIAQLKFIDLHDSRTEDTPQ